ncbi:MAG: YncE family protein [bacterium]
MKSWFCLAMIFLIFPVDGETRAEDAFSSQILSEESNSKLDDLPASAPNSKLYFPSPEILPEGIAWDGTYLWVVDLKPTDERGPRIYKLDPEEGSVLTSFPSPGGYPEGLVFDGHYLWNIDLNPRTLVGPVIYKLNPEDGSILLSFPAPGVYPGSLPTGLAWDGVCLWVADAQRDRIYRISAQDGAIITSFPSPGPYPTGLVWDGDYLWNLEAESERLYKIDSTTGQVAARFPYSGQSPYGLASKTGEPLWSTDYAANMIYRYEEDQE